MRRIKKPFLKETLVTFVLDESGSMDTRKRDTIAGFNAYLETLKTDPHTKYLFSLTKFESTKIDRVCIGIPAGQVSPLTERTYRPGGSTPLYDAVAQSIRAADTFLELARDRNRKPAMLFVIMTDGLENASREFTKESIKRAIETRAEEGWTFVYMGANQDAWGVGSGLGLERGNTLSFDTLDMKETFACLSACTKQYAAFGSAQSKSFFSTKTRA